VRRRDFIKTIAGSAIAWPLAAGAQQSAMPVVGFLSGRSLKSDGHLVKAFRQGLNDAGYIDGQNVAIEYRWADGQFDRLLELGTDLVRNNAVVLFAGAVDVKIKAIKAGIPKTPIVFATGGDLVELGLVASMSRPGGNVTGVTVNSAELWPKQLELLRKLAGSPNLIGVLVNPNNVTAKASVREVEAAARAINQKVLIVNAGTENDFESAFKTLIQKQAGGLLVSVDALLTNRREKIVALAATHALPAIYGRREFADAGGLMSYGANIVDQYRQSGYYAGRILKGDNPSSLPVLQPTKFEFVINMKTAKTLGLDVPLLLQQIADDVIE
jgi:putative tryptophan/tyrosine transport system substrate-binding protein